MRYVTTLSIFGWNAAMIIEDESVGWTFVEVPSTLAY